ncbi:MAG: molybdopterin-synthase adenylyltransferase MoeB [candidate division NC10 bacterium]|nr:molybdopterin-synthase adenylyltransferase MoeB [candidate division NC10 bacterium]MDE2322485.1 molybdopterin-synthase adenylyltransferase MoeB [candidate division NC10 bacterium]
MNGYRGVEVSQASRSAEGDRREAIRVYIPTPYRGLTQNQPLVKGRGDNLVELLEDLETRFPGIHRHVFDKMGELHRHLNVYVNNVAVEELGGKRTALKEGDEVALIPAMAGGAVPFNEEQVRRYSRHIILPEVGGKGQRKLLNSSALLVGAGGLGSPAALYLAAAGVGRLGIIDADVVDLSNLQRQILHHMDDVGRPKVISAVETIGQINPDVKVEPIQAVLSSANAKDVISQYDLVVNGCDNFPTRYLVNDACVLLKKPLVDGSIFKFEGQVTVFIPGQGCYRCLYPAPPPPGLVPSCQEAGVLGVLCGIVGSLQAIEAIKLLLGIGDSLAGRLLFFDSLGMEFRQVKVRRDSDCPVCGDHPTITDLIDYHEFCGVPGGDH